MRISDWSSDVCSSDLWRRGLGIALTLIGVLIVTWRPGGLSLSTGLWFVAASAFAGAAGAVLMKQVDGVKPFRFQAWVGLVSATVLTLASILLEDGQWTAATTTGRPLVAAVVFTALDRKSTRLNSSH